MTETVSLHHVFQCWSFYMSYHCIFLWFKHGLVVSLTLYLCMCVCFVFTSPSRTWGLHCIRSLCSPSSLCSREWPLKVQEPKHPSLPPGQITLLTSAWTSWVQACSPPSLASPASTPSNKVRGIVDLAWIVTMQPSFAIFFKAYFKFGSLIHWVCSVISR